MHKELFIPVEGEPLRLEPRIGLASCPSDGTRSSDLRAAVERAVGEAVVAGCEIQHASPATGTSHRIPHTGDAEGSEADIIDPLTGVLRQDRLESELLKYVARYRREDFPISIICLDIDFLRRYNDQYGMKAGDSILHAVGEYLQRALREEDLIARVEGDCFVAALQADAKSALAVSQRLLVGIKRLSIQAGGASLRVAVSAGTAGFPEHGAAAQDLYTMAMMAMLAAKTRGRSTCVMFDMSMLDQRRGKEKVDRF